VLPASFGLGLRGSSAAAPAGLRADPLPEPVAPPTHYANGETRHDVVRRPQSCTSSTPRTTRHDVSLPRSRAISASSSADGLRRETGKSSHARRRSHRRDPDRLAHDSLRRRRPGRCPRRAYFRQHPLAKDHGTWMNQRASRLGLSRAAASRSPSSTPGHRVPDARPVHEEPDLEQAGASALSLRHQQRARERRSGHGTHVASTIAQSTSNGIGATGVAFNARLMPVKVLNGRVGTTADVADGSAGRPSTRARHQPEPRRTAQLDRARKAVDCASQNVVTVAAAGSSGGKVSYPARPRHRRSATDPTIEIAKFSSRGDGVDIAARASTSCSRPSARGPRKCEVCRPAAPPGLAACRRSGSARHLARREAVPPPSRRRSSPLRRVRRLGGLREAPRRGHPQARRRGRHLTVSRRVAHPSRSLAIAALSA
jgi:hypothetical protein